MANTNNRQQILDFYDRGWHPLVAEYYGHSDYMNYGYWTADTKNQAEASDNLIGRLLAMIPEKKGRILDVACGRGASTRHLLRHYQPSDIVAINISEKRTRVATDPLRVRKPRQWSRAATCSWSRARIAAASAA